MVVWDLSRRGLMMYSNVGSMWFFLASTCVTVRVCVQHADWVTAQASHASCINPCTCFIPSFSPTVMLWNAAEHLQAQSKGKTCLVAVHLHAGPQ